MAQKLLAGLESRNTTFREQLQSVRMRTNIDYDMLENMDEAPVYFDIHVVPEKTIEIEGKKMVKVRTTGSEKHHITVVLSCTASGDLLPPMIIFKRQDGKMY